MSATYPLHTIVLPDRVVRRMENAERTAGRAQRIASRRQGPHDRQPGSRRYVKATNRVARKKHRAADIRKTAAHKETRAIADSATHVVLEKLPIQNMTKSAKGTTKKPGKIVKQKSGLNCSILLQNWGLISILLQYKMVGGVIMVAAPYTRNVCGFTDKGNHTGRQFKCI